MGVSMSLRYCSVQTSDPFVTVQNYNSNVLHIKLSKTKRDTCLRGFAFTFHALYKVLSPEGIAYLSGFALPTQIKPRHSATHCHSTISFFGF